MIHAAAAELLDLLRDPEARAVVEAAASEIPTPVLDQRDAAARDAKTLAHRLVPTGRPEIPLNVDTIPDWVALPLFDGLLTWAAGEATTCVHAPSPEQHAPIVMAAWRPGHVSCPACAAHEFRPGSAAACDRCGLTSSPVRTAWITSGAAVYLVRVCAGCRQPRPAEEGGLA